MSPIFLLSVSLTGCDSNENSSNNQPPSKPVLDNLVITASTDTSLTFAMPTFTSKGNPTPIVQAWIGEVGQLSVVNDSVNGTIIEGPVDVSQSGYTFINLETETNYIIIVIASNSEGFSSISADQATKPLRIAYNADQDTDNVYELYSVCLDSSGLVKLNQSIISNVTGISWSPDGKKMAYMAVENGSEPRGLYAIRSDGTDRVKLNGDLALGRSITGYIWSPDSTKILYKSDEATSDLFELYCVNSDGTNRIKITPPLTSETGISDFNWSPDSSRVVYRLGETTMPYIEELYAVNSDGSDWTKLNPTLVSGGSMSNYFETPYAWSPDGSKIVYRVDQEIQGMYELYTVNPDGSGCVKLNAEFIEEGDVLDFEWSPDGNKILYLADQEIDEVKELYCVNADGSNRIKLNTTLSADRDVLQNYYFWSPDSTRIVYVSDEEVDNRDELYSINSDGTGRTKINGTLVSDGDILYVYGWNTDGNKVIYLADQDIDNAYEIYSVDYNGSNLVKGTSIN